MIENVHSVKHLQMLADGLDLETQPNNKIIDLKNAVLNANKYRRRVVWACGTRAHQSLLI